MWGRPGERPPRLPASAKSLARGAPGRGEPRKKRLDHRRELVGDDPGPVDLGPGPGSLLVGSSPRRCRGTRRGGPRAPSAATDSRARTSARPRRDRRAGRPPSPEPPPGARAPARSPGTRRPRRIRPRPARRSRRGSRSCPASGLPAREGDLVGVQLARDQVERAVEVGGSSARWPAGALRCSRRRSPAEIVGALSARARDQRLRQRRAAGLRPPAARPRLHGGAGRPIA